jgi:hypothetical protein
LGSSKCLIIPLVRPCHRAGTRYCRNQLRQSKIENLDFSAIRNKDVRRLDVAMDDALLMRRV